nr:DNA-directed RNA polymerase I subunit RPA1 isoform X1 [Leptinotarsa decemlineata]
MIENKQSQTYKTILQNVILMRAIIQVIRNKGDPNTLTISEAKEAYNYARGNTAIEKLNNIWEEIQNDVNGLVDKVSTHSQEGEGLKQIIEKKEGIIRMCMMGKRVNFSARSVITPDPNLDIDEIGIPEEFAKRLTYPVAVTPWNIEEMRKLISNGPNKHPGAVMVEQNGVVRRINPKNSTQHQSILKCLLTPDEKGTKHVKIVHRHLCNGDILLLNRQPTLHKPSIMAHRARILKGEKTLRLHYANCKAYNADFDGDEMNAHFPQNELARSEGYNIVNVSNQYLVPKDGTPLSGLIQDHIISGVHLGMRGRFFTKEDYHQLIYQALAFKTTDIILLPPAILKPNCLWSGKQLISTVIINVLPEGKPRINLTSTSKIPVKAWQSCEPRHWKAGGTLFKTDNDMSEAEVIIRNGELLCGILDKNHYGATTYGLTHCVYELYGGTYATRLLSSFGKIFMYFLQQEGFTLGVRDILTVPQADAKRKKLIKSCRQIGNGVMATALNLPKNTSPTEILDKLEELSSTNPKMRTLVDRQYKTSLDKYTNEINKACLPAGLISKFPHNNLQLMVQSGAKGSTVNTMQISCLLGQIELEGKRPPLMISGRSLPSFPPFEFSPRSGGFIDGRFMTGIQPQEFFFHCMAGREGLIDTAVKTSRSGYLQRCLIKHLEGLRVHYDMTVRNSDASVIQFLYGEDGMDVTKAQFLNEKQLGFLSENVSVLSQKDIIKQLKRDKNQDQLKLHKEQIAQWKRKFGNPLQRKRQSPFSLFSQYVKSKAGKNKEFSEKQIMQYWREIDEEIRQSFTDKCETCPDPIDSIFQPDANFGSINELQEKLIEDFQPFKRKKAKKEFEEAMKLKVMQSMCAPGEPVGLLAAQSIGEPSTQMTLNTFHFAGRGDMNVTLGIPRLREILMMASKNIKTPSMEIPFKKVPNMEKNAVFLRKLLTRVTVADVLEVVHITTEQQIQPVRQHQYEIKFNFLPRSCYGHEYCVKPKQILHHMKQNFFGEMFAAIRKFTKINSHIITMDESRKKRSANTEEDNEGESQIRNENAQMSSSEDEVEDSEDAKTTIKFKEIRDGLEPEDEEKEASDSDNEELEGNEDMKDVEKNQQTEPNSVVESHNFAQNYLEDTKKYLWCKITFGLPLNYKKLHLTEMLKDVASKSVIWQISGIKRAITYTKNDSLMLRTDGANIVEMFKHHDTLDLLRLHCNDIHQFAWTYGIEAASKIIVKEVKDVFDVYGIKVDPRHLSLIADYMTFSGTYEPMSRKGMESSPSPLQQMSFESSLTYLKNAVIRGKRDDLQNPSSSLMVGKPIGTGTGCVSLFHKIKTNEFKQNYGNDCD